MGEIFTEGEWLLLARRFKFTRRELQVARALFKDKTEDQIATCLGIAAPTVHKHLQRLRVKTGASTRLGIALHLWSAIRESSAEHRGSGDQLSGQDRSEATE
jgi:DNA-binding CsgD family transcriptional regulator